MDERPLDPSRLYLLKHTHADGHGRGRTGRWRSTKSRRSRSPTSRPLVFDRYRDIRATGSFILIDPATNFTAGAGMIIDAIRDDHAAEYRPNAAERLAKHRARRPASHEEAVAAMQRALEELLK